MLDEGVLPLPFKIAEKAKELGVQRITLDWQGGSDEGHLNVDTDPSPWGAWDNDPSKKTQLHDLVNDITDWAVNAWEYNGAGDGTDYGDSLVYDLENGKVEVSEWHMQRKDSRLPRKKLRIADE